MKLTAQHVEALRAADRIVARAVDEKAARGESIPDGFHRARLTELCPEAAAALHCFLEGRKAAAKRIDPLTCEWAVTFSNDMDPYRIWVHENYCIGRDFVVWDESSDGEIYSCDLSEEQRVVLRERIEREAGMPVLSSVANIGRGWQVMPMPSSRDVPTNVE